MSKITEVAYAALFTRYREASMLADKYELIAKTHQNVNKSLRETNDDLRRMLLEENEKNDALNDQNHELRELVKEMWACVTGNPCWCCEHYIGPENRDHILDMSECELAVQSKRLGIEVYERGND